MKKFEKIVPVLASGLVVAGLGTVDAFAVDEPDTQVQADTPPAETQQSETSNSSTEIKNVTTTTPPEQTETGGTATEGVVNLDVDSNGDTTIDGSLTVTTTPGNSTTSDPSTTVTTNPDGSTTTTTTTTTTEKSETEIKGEVSTDPVDPSEDEKNEVKDEVGKDVNDAKGGDGSYDWTAIEEKYGEVTEGTDASGNPTHTFEFSQSSTPDNKPLSKDELSTVLGKDLTPVEGQENTYTYKDGDTTVTVKVTDTSTETTTTKWTVTVTEKTEDKTDSVDVNTPVVDIVDIEDSETPRASAEEILGKVDGNKFGEQDAVISKDAAGNITKIEVGDVTYSFTYTETENNVEIGDLSNDQILALLPADGGYKVEGDNIVDKDGHVLSFGELQGLTAKQVNITMTVTDKKGAQTSVGGKTEDEIDAMKNKATKEAILAAAKNAAVAQGLMEETDSYWSIENWGESGSNVRYDAEAGTYTFTLVKDGNKTYTFTVTPEDATYSNVKWTENNSDSDKYVEGSGSTTTITGNAYVSGETVVWTESKDSTVSFIGADGKVNVTVGNKIDDKEEVKTVTSTDNSAIVTTVYTDEDGNTVTKTYTFKYDQVTKLTPEEKSALLAQLGEDADVTDLSNLIKTTWTVEVKTESTQTEPKNETIIKVDGLTKGDGDSYTYKDGDDTITLTKGNDGKYTGTSQDGNTTYTIVEEDVPLTDIETVLKEKYGDTLTVDQTTRVATYTNSKGETVTVSYSAQKKLTVKKETVTKQDHANTDLSKLIEEIKTLITNNPGVVYTANGHQLKVENGSLKVEGNGNWYEITTETSEGWTWIKDDTAVNFDSMNPTDLQKYLESLKKQADDAGKSHKSLNHLDLDSGAWLTLPDGEKVECVILNGNRNDIDLKFTWDDSADVIVSGNGGTTTNVTNSITWDNDHYEFGHNLIENPKHSTYYRVEGEVGYNFVKKNAGSASAAQKIVDELVAAGHEKAGYVKVGSQYYVYQDRADLTAYGYMSYDYNNCKEKGTAARPGRGYDLFLDDLTLLEDGRVIGSNTQVKNYKVNLTGTSSSDVGTGTSLTVKSLTTSSTNTTAGDSGSEITGKYQVTETKQVKEDQGGTEVNKYTGTGTGSYDSYQTYVTTQQTGSATGTQYGGNLSYNYEVPADPIVAVTGETQTNRDIQVTLENTSVTTNSNSNTTTPSRGGDRTPTPPTPPVVDIPEEDPPLVDVPEEEPPLVDIPEEEPPLVDIPEEEPPLVDVPEEEPPLVDVPDAQPPKVTIPAQKVPLAKAPAPSTVDILDEEVPLADVPKTGESPASLLAAAAASLSVLGLGILKKREED